MKESKNYYLKKLEQLSNDLKTGVTIHEILENFSRNITSYFTLTSAIIFFERNPFVPTAIIAKPKSGKEKVPKEINRDTCPWLEDTEREEFPGHLIYTELDNSHPLKIALKEILGYNTKAKTILIYPLFLNDKIIGGFHLFDKTPSRKFNREELKYLNEAAEKLIETITKLVRLESAIATNKIMTTIINTINGSLESIAKEGGIKPDIITEVLLSVFDVRRVLLFNKDEKLGNNIYESSVSEEDSKISSTLYQFSNESFTFMIDESDKDWGAENSIPIMSNKQATGRLFVDYVHSDHAFKDSFLKTMNAVAPTIVQLLYM